MRERRISERCSMPIPDAEFNTRDVETTMATMGASLRANHLVP